MNPGVVVRPWGHGLQGERADGGSAWIALGAPVRPRRDADVVHPGRAPLPFREMFVLRDGPPPPVAVRRRALRVLRNPADDAEALLQLAIEGMRFRPGGHAASPSPLPGAAARRATARRHLAAVRRMSRIAGVAPRMPDWQSYTAWFYRRGRRCWKFLKRGRVDGDAARRLRALRSPSVVRVHAWGREWIEMDHAPGPRMSDRRPRRAWWPAVARAAADLSAAGLFPVDPAPSNFVLSPRGPVWVDVSDMVLRPSPSERRAGLFRFAFLAWHLLARRDVSERAERHRDGAFRRRLQAQGDGWLPPPARDALAASTLPQAHAYFRGLR